MNRNDFILPVSIIKVQEKKLLSHQKLIRMLETNTSREILKILNDTDYTYSMVGVNNEEMYEDIFKNEINRVFKFVRELAKNEQDIVDIFALKYEYQNLKLMLKNENSKMNLEDFIIDTEIKNKKILNENFKLASKEKNIQYATILLDKMYLEHIYLLSKNLNIDIFTKYVKLVIDKYNIITFLRLKNQNRNIDYVEEVFVDNGSITKLELVKLYQDINYINKLKKIYESKEWDYFEKEKNISKLEKMFDNLIIELAKNYRNVNIGPEPLFTYLIAKDYEIKALRLIISSKLNSVDVDLVKDRLRGTYV